MSVDRSWPNYRKYVPRPINRQVASGPNRATRRAEDARKPRWMRAAMREQKRLTLLLKLRGVVA